MTYLLLCFASLAADPVAVTISPDARFVVARADQGREVLGRQDIYIQTTGALERQIRLRSELPVSREAFARHAQEQVLDWSPKQVNRLTTVAASLVEKLDALNLPLPEEVLLVKTTGDDESGAAYTRAGAIMLTERRLAGRDAGFERLLAHELFHVLSRHSPAVRRKLYALIGFQPCNPIELTAELEAIKLTNPDAPTIDYYITIEHEGEELHVVPVLLSDRERYDPQRKRLFDYMTFKLLAVEEHDGQWRPLLRDGKPVLIDGRANKSYREKIGKNTNYIIHPDEILADNFSHLAMRTKDLPSPEIVERMREILQKGEP